MISIASTALFATYNYSLLHNADPVIQVRAMELAQARLDEILALKYDEKTPTGGIPACNGIGGVTCDNTPDANRNDVDDYNNVSDTPYSTVVNGATYSYTRLVTVTTANNAKLITVTVATPNGFSVKLAAYKANFDAAIIALKIFRTRFTLIEVIAVIVVLSILAAMGVKFVVESTNSYQSTQTRSRLVNTGRQAIERMTRQLRISLPYSVRITNNNMCLEFMPIASGGNYLNPVPDLANGATATSTISVSPHVIEFGNAQFVSIGAMAAVEVYGTNPVSRATLASRTVNSLSLATARTWQRNSLNQRFYLLDFPQAFCVVNNELRFYSAQDASSASVNLSSSYSVMADSAAATTPFVLAAGSENRNTIVQFNIAFAVKAESVAFNHSVMIRNVP